jgi:hypothetical protein
MNYQRLSDGVINNEIYIVSPSFLNSNLREIAESILGKPNEGEYVIYSPNGNGINILGKFVLYPNSIINSRFFTIFAKNSEVINGENPTPNFSKAKCLQIKDEVFDLSLDNSDYLLRIFSFIVSVAVSEKADFIWMDDRELLFYPTKGDIEITFAPYYFATRLI